MLDGDGDCDPPPPLEPPPSPPHSEPEDELGTSISPSPSTSRSPSSPQTATRHSAPIRSVSSGGLETAAGSPSLSASRSVSTSGLRSGSPTPPSSPSQLSLSGSTGAGGDDDNSKPSARPIAEQAELTPISPSSSSSTSTSSSSSSSSSSSKATLDEKSLRLNLSEVLAEQNSTTKTTTTTTTTTAGDVPNWLREGESERTIANRFLLGDELGRGAFGRVYKTVDIITGKLVAVKEIQKTLIAGDQLNDILREAALLRELNHPNIVKLIKAYQTERHLYFVLEYVEGGSLHDSKKMGVPEILLVRYVLQILQGLEYLHSKNVVHRDIKGANILLTKDGQAKLADFGSCSYARMDRKLTMIGTPFWMAPEVIAEENNLGFASDVWSLGCTVIEVLTGAPPYWKLGAEKALFRMCIDPHPPLPEGVSDTALDFLKQCFVRDPSARPSATALLSHPWIVHNMELSSSVGDGMETVRELTRQRRPDLQSLWDNPPDVQLRQITAPKRPTIPAVDPMTPQHQQPATPFPQTPLSSAPSTPLGAGPLSPMPVSLTSGKDNKDSPDPRSTKEGKESKGNPVRFSKKLQFFRERERASSMATDIKRTPTSERSSSSNRRSKKNAKDAEIEQAVSLWAGEVASPKQPKATRVRHSRQRSTSLLPGQNNEAVMSRAHQTCLDLEQQEQLVVVTIMLVEIVRRPNDDH